LATTALRSSL